MREKFKIIHRAAGAIIIAFTALYGHAQQKPHHTQYILNQFVLNPALTGIENYTDVRVSHRHQWVGLLDAPVTTYLSFHTPLGKADERNTATSFSSGGANPMGAAYWQEYQASPAHHGIGFQFMNDNFGPFRNVTAHATYAYHLGLSNRTNLSGGFGLGINSFTLNSGKLFFGPDFPVDPAVTGGGRLGKINLDLNAGLWLYSADYFVGLSAQQLNPARIDFSAAGATTGSGKLVPHYFATAGYRFLAGEDWNVLPSVLVKIVNPVPAQVDLNVKLQYRDIFWTGASYRFQYGYAGMVGVRVMNTLMFSYAYDYTTTRLNTVSNGTHEVMLGFAIPGRNQGFLCPKNIW